MNSRTMASRLYINKIKAILNADNEFSDEEIEKMAITLLNLYKTVQKIMKYVDYKQNGNETNTNTNE